MVQHTPPPLKKKTKTNSSSKEQKDHNGQLSQAGTLWNWEPVWNVKTAECDVTSDVLFGFFLML